MKKKLNDLVQASYRDGVLDASTVQQIADRLNRQLLKHYINLLKQEEKKSMIFVTTPKPLTTTDKNKIKGFFPKKRIIENIDPEMINGIKIVENDEAYEINLNQTIHDIIRFVNND